MQENADEGRQPAGGEGTHPSRGFHRDPEEITLWSPGWGSIPATAPWFVTSAVETPAGETKFSWTRVDIPELKLSAAAAMLVLQGAPIQTTLFGPEAAFFYKDEGGFYGPFIYLAGEFVPHAGLLKEVVLAKIENVPDGLSTEQVLGALVKEALDT